MFKTRLISGVILVIALVIIVGSGGLLLYGTLLAASLIGMSELYKVVKVQDRILGIVGYLAAISYYVLLYLNKMEYVLLLAVILLMMAMAVYVFQYPKYNAEQVTMVFFGVFYVAVMLAFVYEARQLADGNVTVWLIFLSSWGCDTCAYCVGVLFGRHKMAPVLSPKKSIEGGVGGVLGAALLGALFAVCVGHFTEISPSPLLFALICGAGGAISQIGDLSASAIKRNHEIKDYGKLIPGHGGILDRFDSVIFTAPVIYYLSVLLG